MKSESAEAARGRWPGILEALGVDHRFLRNLHGPCPVCGGKDRFRFDDQMTGRFYCNQCGSGDGFALLQNLYGWDFQRAAAEVDRVVGRCSITPGRPEHRDSPEAKRAFLKRLFMESRPLEKDDPVMRYLSRRDCLPPYLSDDLRYHPALKHTSDNANHPAMLAVLRDPSGKACGIHRTYLTLDGQKANVNPVRMVIGEAGFVALGPVLPCIGVAEGIETALAASKLFGLPVWSAISAVIVKKFLPPKGVKRLMIFGDNDKNYTGQAAAYALAWRMAREGLGVEVAIPDRPGSDWADVAGEGVT